MSFTIVWKRYAKRDLSLRGVVGRDARLYWLTIDLLPLLGKPRHTVRLRTFARHRTISHVMPRIWKKGNTTSVIPHHRAFQLLIQQQSSPTIVRTFARRFHRFRVCCDAPQDPTDLTFALHLWLIPEDATILPMSSYSWSEWYDTFSRKVSEHLYGQRPVIPLLTLTNDLENDQELSDLLDSLLPPLFPVNLSSSGTSFPQQPQQYLPIEAPLSPLLPSSPVRYVEELLSKDLATCLFPSSLEPTISSSSTTVVATKPNPPPSILGVPLDLLKALEYFLLCPDVPFPLYYILYHYLFNSDVCPQFVQTLKYHLYSHSSNVPIQHASAVDRHLFSLETRSNLLTALNRYLYSLGDTSPYFTAWHRQLFFPEALDSTSIAKTDARSKPLCSVTLLPESPSSTTTTTISKTSSEISLELPPSTITTDSRLLPRSVYYQLRLSTVQKQLPSSTSERSLQLPVSTTLCHKDPPAESNLCQKNPFPHYLEFSWEGRYYRYDLKQEETVLCTICKNKV